MKHNVPELKNLPTLDILDNL